MEFTFTRPVDKWPQNAVLRSENHQILTSNHENLHRSTILLPLKRESADGLLVASCDRIPAKFTPKPPFKKNGLLSDISALLFSQTQLVYWDLSFTMFRCTYHRVSNMSSSPVRIPLPELEDESFRGLCCWPRSPSLLLLLSFLDRLDRWSRWSVLLSLKSQEVA